MSPSSMERGASTASLDRIDSSEGYVPGNVQWVHLVVNDLKSNMPQEEFLNWCRDIAAYGAEFGLTKKDSLKPRLGHLKNVADYKY